MLQKSNMLQKCSARTPAFRVAPRIAVPAVSSRVSQSISRSASLRVTCQAAATDAQAVAVAAAPKKAHPSLLSQAAPALYAIVEVGGHQMFVEPGKWYTCNRLQAEVGSKIKFGRVLALKKDGKLSVGMPYLENVTIEAEVIEELRGPKVIVYKMRPKKHYRKKQGHRQDLSKFMVSKIEMA